MLPSHYNIFSLRQSGTYGFCEIEFVLRAQTRFHAFPMNVKSKRKPVLFIPSGMMCFPSCVSYKHSKKIDLRKYRI
jgi:hypothetical protein